MIFTIILTLALLPFILAATFEVQVGPAGSFVYNPPSINGAADGDTINFTFNPGNHSVIQSSFNTPCAALSGGFSTDFVPVSTGTTVKSFTVPAGTATKPLWFYCGQISHCQLGMVFAINAPQAPSPNTYDAFKTLAMGVAGLTSDSAAATLGSHNPSTAIGSLFTASSVHEGPTGSATIGLNFTTAGVTPSASGSAPASTGKSSGADSLRVRNAVLECGLVFLGGLMAYII